MGFFSFLIPTLPQEIFLKRIKEMPDFVIRQQFWSYDDKPFNGVLVDDKNKKIALLSHLESLGFMGTLGFFEETMEKLRQEQPNLSDDELTKLTKKIVDQRNKENEYLIQMCNYNDLLRSEVVEDGNSVTYTRE